jgi:demethylmenaquinone methyltransferase/2-methoxy-6-polyprenyl-1,4-benzoquinol methylase
MTLKPHLPLPDPQLSSVYGGKLRIPAPPWTSGARGGLHSLDVDVSRLPDPRPTRAKDVALVQRMFDRVAPRYDVTNTVLSAGQDRHWRRVAVRALDPAPGALVLDVAAGTGMLSEQLRATGARVLALDVSLEMLQVGARRGTPGIGWCNGDALRLPLRDASVDGVTIAFGLRNLPGPEAGLAEFARVLRPGGRLVVLEFSRPGSRVFRAASARALRYGVPAVARMISSDAEAYRYLGESILAWPDQPSLAHLIAGAGFEAVGWKSLSWGMVAVHRGIRPPLRDPGPAGG